MLFKKENNNQVESDWIVQIPLVQIKSYSNVVITHTFVIETGISTIRQVLFGLTCFWKIQTSSSRINGHGYSCFITWFNRWFNVDNFICQYITNIWIYYYYCFVKMRWLWRLVMLILLSTMLFFLCARPSSFYVQNLYHWYGCFFPCGLSSWHEQQRRP